MLAHGLEVEMAFVDPLAQPHFLIGVEAEEEVEHGRGHLQFYGSGVQLQQGNSGSQHGVPTQHAAGVYLVILLDRLLLQLQQLPTEYPLEVFVEGPVLLREYFGVCEDGDRGEFL